MSIPVSQQAVQYYTTTTREGTTVAIAQKTGSGSSVSGSDTVVPVSAVTSGASTTLPINAETLQLMGMAQLPNSNLVFNYPHTMWERDAEGNRIQIAGVAAGGSGAAAGQAVVKTETGAAGDALSQAAAVIKSEVAPVKTVTNVINKSFICEICNKAFAKREHLTKHTRIHKDTKR